jgi:hypothetical protein
MILAFWKGTTLGAFGMVGGVDKLKEMAVEMIVAGIRAGISKKQQIEDYKNQLDHIEGILCIDGVVKPKTVKKIAKNMNMTTDALTALWAVNIMALLTLKVIQDDENYGFMVLQ